LYQTQTKPGKEVFTTKGDDSASHKRMNRSIFEGYLRDLQESISKMWRITPEVVARYADIAKFQATRQTMWIQAKNDLEKQWLQMHYCITEGDIDMVISEWPDEWRIPTITKEVSERTTEEEAEQGETQPPRNPSAQETKNGPRQDNTERRRAKEDRDPEGEEGEYTTDQGTTETG
jgi:hypothetical protein